MRNVSPASSALVIAALLFLVFGTPLRWLWTYAGAPWWSPYALWGSAIVAVWVVRRTADEKQPEPESDTR
jgi:hypothetical protein